jgi:hypothetical protein
MLGISCGQFRRLTKLPFKSTRTFFDFDSDGGTFRFNVCPDTLSCFLPTSIEIYRPVGLRVCPGGHTLSSADFDKRHYPILPIRAFSKRSTASAGTRVLDRLLPSPMSRTLAAVARSSANT